MGSVAEGDYPLFTFYGKDVASVVIFIIGFIGFCGNMTIAWFTRKLPTMNNPFGRLLASQASGEMVLCGVFAFYVAPMMFWDNATMIKYSYNAGWINLIAYDICTWSHLFISINRFVAICLPMRYETVFSKRNTWIMICFTWVAGIIWETIVHRIADCLFIFDAPHWAFLYETFKPVCAQITWYSDFTRDISFVICIGIIDVITIFQVHRLNKMMVAVSQAQLVRRKREVNFLKQAILQMLVFVAELCTYFVLCKHFIDQRWIFWVMTSVAWVLVHCTDSSVIAICEIIVVFRLIILTFNREFRKLITSPLRKICSAVGKDSTIMYNTGTSHGVTQPSHPEGLTS